MYSVTVLILINGKKENSYGVFGAEQVKDRHLY